MTRWGLPFGEIVTAATAGQAKYRAWKWGKAAGLADKSFFVWIQVTGAKAEEVAK